MSPDAPDISVAIVSYNTRDLLRACLRSLAARQADGEASLEIFVADNGSTDGSPAMVQAEFPDVHLIETGGNIGFGRANNLALENATGSAFCLLNSDAELLPGALSLSLAALDTSPEIGLIGGQLLWPDGRLQTSFGDDPTLGGIFAEQTFLSALRKRPPPPPLRVDPSPASGRGVPTSDSNLNPSLIPMGEGSALAPGVGAIFDVDQICGAFMLIRPEAWRQVGGFDPHYFMYNEDVDLNFRLRRAGWRVVFLPNARITHHLGASSSADWQKRARMVSAYNESRFYYFSRFYGPASGAKLKAYCLLGAAIRLTGWSVLSLVRPGAKDKVKLFQEVWQRTKAMAPASPS
ncbi:MAG: glycosyltransferase family 2 protein [Janthinobacterium lividum]